jgi:hypothetical protein
MAETVAIIGAVVAVAGAAYGVYSNVQASEAAEAAAAAQRAQSEEQRGLVATQAAQQEADRREELNRILGAGAALRGARGLDIAGVGGQTIREENIARAERDVRNIELNQGVQDRRLALAGDVAEAQGNAQSAAYMGRAAESAASTFRSGANLYGYLARA